MLSRLLLIVFVAGSIAGCKTKEPPPPENPPYGAAKPAPKAVDEKKK